MPDYFFDTSVLIAYFKREDPRTLTMLADVIAARATAAISAMTIAELWAAPEMANPTRQAERLAVVSMLQIVVIDQGRVAMQGTPEQLMRMQQMQKAQQAAQATPPATQPA